MALVVARVLSPRSKLSTTTALTAETAKHVLAEELSLGDVDVHELYSAMDWLATRQKRINEDLRGVNGLDWISALRTELLKAMEETLKPIRLATERKSLRGEQEIGLRVGKVIGKHKMAKHFDLTITETSFTYTRNEGRIREEAALDGLYVVRRSVDEKRMDSDRVVETYKSLAKVERAFRCMKTIDLSLRPIYHRNKERIRSHVFICMLAYYVEWHMHEKLRPVLFADDDRESAAAARNSIVAPAQRSELATPYQQHVLDLLGVTPN